jgi:hypothetical protein
MFYFDRVSQARRTHASIGFVAQTNRLIPLDETALLAAAICD